MEVIVEQLGTTNNVLERQKFDTRRVEIGRAFSNDVILCDEHVDPVHAALEFDAHGRLVIQDLGSVNGIRRPRHKQRIDRDEVRSGEIFLIGRSRIRIWVGRHPVPPAVRIRAAEGFLLWLGKPGVAIALVLAWLLVKLVTTWLGTIGEFRLSVVVERNLGEVTVFIALVVGVYFLSVLFRRGGNFLAHLSLLVLLFLVSALLDALMAIVVFNAGDRAYPLLRVVDDGLGYVELAVYLWSVLYLAFHLPLLQRTVITLFATAIIFGLNHLPEDDSMRLVDQQSFPLEQRFLPPSLLLRSPADERVFEARLDGVFEELARLRSEALKRRDEHRTQAPRKRAEPEQLRPNDWHTSSGEVLSPPPA